jgi:hypothetical protein
MTDRKLTARWQADEGRVLAEEVVARLLVGRPLRDLPLGEVDGRFDLRGLPMPQPRRLRRYELDGWFIEELSDRLLFKGVRLAGLDLSGAMLDSSRFWDCSIEDSVFERARCQHWGLLRTEVVNCSFAGADLRQAAVGTWSDGGNVYRGVSFVQADFRVGSCPAATFIDCDFSRARLEKVDFQSTSFVRCRFAGDLVEVMFYDHGFNTGKPAPNQMEDVDFTGAVLHDVEFRRLNLDKVTFPVSAGHLVLRHYRCVIERALTELAEERTREARLLKVTLEHQLRWAGPDQQVGMVSLLDLEDSGGPPLAELAANLLRRCEVACDAA